MNNGPKVLVFDIETAPIMAYVFDIWEQNIGLNQIHKDWHLLSVAAKWLHDPKSKIMYKDQRDEKNIEDDKNLCKWIWELLDEAQIVITKNGKRFDAKKLNARFALNKLKPPSPYRHYDVGVVAKNKFGFTSNKLEYLTEKLCPEYAKLKHDKFPGFNLWLECLRGNPKAWAELKKYNCMDVLGTEAVYHHLAPYDPQINFSVYTDDEEETICQCGSKDLRFKGYYYSNSAKQKCWRCNECGAYWRDRKNLLAKKKKQWLKLPAK